MVTKTGELSRSHSLAAKVIYAAFTALKENGRALPRSRVRDEVESRVQFDSWATEIYKSTGNTRWKSILSFYSIDCVKAGYLVKKKGVWYLTPEGEEALALGDEKLILSASEAYKEWKSEQNSTNGDSSRIQDKEIDPSADPNVTLEQVQQISSDTIRSHLVKKNAYEMQDIVAALFRAMGYYTPFVAPRGKDGGVDVIVYRDPLGAESPRIKVQVKHRQDTARVDEVRQLVGILHKDAEIGVFVSTGGFSLDAKQFARTSPIHTELIDMERLISLWQEFYEKLSEEDKAMLPLQTVHVLAPN